MDGVFRCFPRSDRRSVRFKSPSSHARNGIVRSLARNNLGKSFKRADRQEQHGSVPAVWSPVLVLALMLALDPLRLGLLLLLITRPRPVHSLLVYWVGAMTVSVPYMLVPLIVLHVTPGFRSFAQHACLPRSIFGSPTARHIQIGMGVVALLIAALMAIRLRASQRAYVATPANTASPLVAESNTPTAISQPLDRAPDAPTEGRSPIRRLFAPAAVRGNGCCSAPSVRGNPNPRGSH